MEETGKITVALCNVGVMEENCWIVSREDRNDCVIIDPGDDASEIRKVVAGKSVSAILLTHGHFDHIGAVDELCDICSNVYIHEKDVPCLSSSKLNAAWMLGRECICQATPTIIYGEQDICEAGITFHVLHTPGHTEGSVCYMTGNFIFTGDTLFPTGDCGRTDLPGGSEEKMMASLHRLMPLISEKVICGGHG